MKKIWAGFGVAATALLVLTEAGDLLSATLPNQPSSQSEIQLAQRRRRGGRTARPRGPRDPLIPYVISPRNTQLLSDRPSFKWNPPPGVERYTVSLLNGDTVIWTQQVTANEMPYPAEAAALQPGIDYTLLVQASNDRSSQEDQAFQSFRLLPSSEAEVIRQSEALFTAPSEQTALLKATLYMGSRLYGEAIATLEALVAQGTQSATVYRQLGDLYAETDLVLLAEDSYLKAVPLAANNLEEQALVQTALGNLYEQIEEFEEAIRWLTQAKQSYAQLGNQYQVQQLDQQIQELSEL